MHRLRELRTRQDHCDGYVTWLAFPGLAKDLQPVVARSGYPPGSARIEVDCGGRVAYGVEGTGVPARPWTNVLGNLVGEDEIEVRLAQGWLGYSLNLLQDPRAQIGVGSAARAARLPRPAEPDPRQVDIEAHRCRATESAVSTAKAIA